MQSEPLESLRYEEAKALQFRLIDCITREFTGEEILSAGDYGVRQPLNQPCRTRRVERVLADFFGVEDAVFVMGSGTGALREAFAAVFAQSPSRRVLVHQAPIYSTTQTTLAQLGATTIAADFHDWEAVQQAIEARVDAILVQHARQTLSDHYDLPEVVRRFKQETDVPVITDENYAVMKVREIGAQAGADLSGFSMFKLLGPEGVGLVVGKKKWIDAVRAFHYSGGSQIQGPVAMDALRGLIYAPVALAMQAEETEKTVEMLNCGGVTGVEEALVANAQSKVILLRLKQPVAADVLQRANRLGAATWPVGSESRYEFVPMFYRVSGTMRAEDPDAEKYWIRINVMRAGHETVLRILRDALAEDGE